MARRASFTRLVNQIAREQAKSKRESERLAREKQRKIQIYERETLRLQAQNDKLSKQAYLESRIEETSSINRKLDDQIESLNHILDESLEKKSLMNFDDLRIKSEFRDFVIPSDLQSIPELRSIQDYLAPVKKPTTLEKLIPGAEKRYQNLLVEAKNKYQEDKRTYEAAMLEREANIKLLRESYESEKNEYENQIALRNQEVIKFESAFNSGDPEAISAYFAMVLERSNYPDGFPQEFRVAYLPEPKEIIIEYELPGINIIPTVAEYRYSKTKDSWDEKKRRQADVKEQYQDVVASICLRTIHEVIDADQYDYILVIAFNGFVQTVDPSTGRDIKPYLISIRTTKERFNELNLGRIEKRACLRNLGAQISPRPDEMLPVKPIVDFDMVDKRYVEQSDILSDLDDRPNLMELNPFEFENMVSNLFDKIGFQAKLTRSSKDGGVDAVAYDPRPILGGKVVIQAKRYKNVVGVSAVRDLYGTMINEGANKGILVATSHYGPDAYEFAKDKPIELIDGSGLLYLLEQQGIKARIIMPDDNQ